MQARIWTLITLTVAALCLYTGPAQAQQTDEAERIIVSGASGQLGGLVVEELLARGVSPERLILVSRTPETLESYAQMGASTRFGDFYQPESLLEAYAGGTRMLLISIRGAGGEIPRVEAHGNAIRAAVEAGVPHIAYTSSISLSQGNTGGFNSDHVATEQALRDSGVAWTMLRNSVYADTVVQQAANMLRAGEVEVSADANRVAYVTREDCAAAAAAVLLGAEHENRVYEITGPQLAGPREIAEAVRAVTGRDIEVIAEDAPADSGENPPGVAASHTEELIGRPAIGVRELLEAHRDELMAAADE